MKMKHICILAIPDSNLGSIDNPRRGFLFVNQYLKEKGKQPLFKVEIAGITDEIQLSNGIYTLHSDTTIDQIKQTDLVIIPAFEGDIKNGLEEGKAFIPWIIEQYTNGAEVASLCRGAFLLASTGLLNGKTCSTHWKATDIFQKTFPEVQLKADKIITDEEGIYTSGGAFSAANLILYIIEKHAGREIAIACSKMFEIDYDRNSQSQFMIFHGQKNHRDEQIKKVQEFIEKNYRDKITVNQLSKSFALGRRSLERRFKKATSNTLVEYIQRVKIEAVKKQMEKKQETVNELMYDVGYNDPKSFRNLFKKCTGLSPTDYQKKFSKAVAN